LYMKLKVMEYNGAMVLAVEGERQTLIVREEGGGFTFELLAEGRTVPVFTLESEGAGEDGAEGATEDAPKEGPTAGMPVVAQEGGAIEDTGEDSAIEDAPTLSNGLFERLAALRKKLADAEGVPPFMIFHNKTLRTMIEKMPADMRALRTVSGVGQAKLEKYGPAFLAVINAVGEMKKDA